MAGPPSIKVRTPVDAGADFLRSETAGGVALLIATVVALVWANGPFGDSCRTFWHSSMTLGIGFTVSLFIVSLSFPDEALAGIARLGIFAGSILAAIVGTLLLIRPGSAEAVKTGRATSYGS